MPVTTCLIGDSYAHHYMFDRFLTSGGREGQSEIFCHISGAASQALRKRKRGRESENERMTERKREGDREGGRDRERETEGERD